MRPSLGRPSLPSYHCIHPLHCDRQHKQQNQGKVWWYLTLFLCRALQGSIHPLPPPSPPSQAWSSLSVLFLLLLHWYPPLKSPPYDRISFTHITFLLPNFLKKVTFEPLCVCVGIHFVLLVSQQSFFQDPRSSDALPAEAISYGGFGSVFLVSGK